MKDEKKIKRSRWTKDEIDAMLRGRDGSRAAYAAAYAVDQQRRAA